MKLKLMELNMVKFKLKTETVPTKCLSTRRASSVLRMCCRITAIAMIESSVFDSTCAMSEMIQ